jgi:hypothetical protein
LKSSDLEKIHAKNLCEQITQHIRSHLRTTVSNDKRQWSGIRHYFKHQAFWHKNEPKNLAEEIENITIIKVTVFKNDQGNKPLVTSQSPLMGKELVYTDTL